MSTPALDPIADIASRHDFQPMYELFIEGEWTPAEIESPHPPQELGDRRGGLTMINTLR